VLLEANRAAESYYRGGGKGKGQMAPLIRTSAAASSSVCQAVQCLMSVHSQTSGFGLSTFSPEGGKEFLYSQQTLSS
jgi:hypothetical protein